MSRRFDPHSYLDSFLLQLIVEPFGFSIAVHQPPLATFPSLPVYPGSGRQETKCLPPPTQSPLPEPCYKSGQKRSLEHWALAAKPCCASDATSNWQGFRSRVPISLREFLARTTTRTGGHGYKRKKSRETLLQRLEFFFLRSPLSMSEKCFERPHHVLGLPDTLPSG